MTSLIQPQAEQYAARFSQEETALLQEVNLYTQTNHPQAHMLSGPVQGALLGMISKMIRPNRILEVGTFTGYSALCLASGLKPGGQLHTVECREQDAATARGFFGRSEYREQIFLHLGDAHAIIPGLKEPWDLVFIDADKTSYTDYYELVLPSLPPGGIIIADNVLFHGQVLEEPVTGKNALAIDAFNRHVKADKRVETVLLTVRDGLLIIRKR